MRLIEADAVIHVQTYNEMTEDWCVKETTVENALNYWADEGCPSTVDAVPVEFIEAEIKRMEYEIEHALIKYKHADGTIERMIARKAALEFILAKWKHMCSNCQEFDCYGCRYKREEE